MKGVYFLKTFSYFGFIHGRVLPACMCLHHVWVVPMEFLLDPLELEIEMVVNCEVGAWELNWGW